MAKKEAAATAAPTAAPEKKGKKKQFKKKERKNVPYGLAALRPDPKPGFPFLVSGFWFSRNEERETRNGY